MSKTVKDRIVILCTIISLPFAYFAYLAAKVSINPQSGQACLQVVASMFMQLMLFFGSEQIIRISLKSLRTGRSIYGIDLNNPSKIENLRAFWTEFNLRTLVCWISVCLTFTEIYNFIIYSYRH